jgi:hypothetical protein
MQKFNRTGFQAYLIECIDDDYLTELNKPRGSDREKLISVHEIFKSEMAPDISRAGERKAFSDWLAGLCGAVSLHFMTDDIEDVLIQFDAITEKTSAKKQEYYILTWFDFCADRYMKLIQRALKNNKINY